MKKSTSVIIEKLPSLEKHFQADDNIFMRQHVLDKLDDIEQTFIKLIWFFEDIEKNSFDLKKIYKTLEGDWLLFALEVIEIFFKSDLYLIKEPLNSLIISDDYVDQTGASRKLMLDGLDSYTQNKIATYIHRNKFPQPDLVITNKRYWKKSTINDFANSIRNEN